MWAGAKSCWVEAAVSIRALLAGFGMLALALGAAAPASTAAEPRPLTLSPEEKVLIGNIEDYLNGITTLESRFVQVSAQGGFARGKFYLHRPGRMRFEYDPPAPYLLVADGVWFIYVDKELEQVTYLPLKKTPADLLLRENFSFSAGLVITGLDRIAGAVHVTVVDSTEPDSGQVTLIFNEEPLSLKSWIVRDQQGQRVQVTLTESRFGVKLDSSLFTYAKPVQRRRD